MAEPHNALDRLGQAIAAAHDTVLQQDGVLAQARSRLLAAHSAPRPREHRIVALAAAAGLVVVVAVALAIGLWPRPTGLTFVAGGQPGAVGGWLASADDPLDIRFSDGSRIRLAPRSGGRVHQVRRHGAHILLEHGSAEVTVVPGPAARWEVEAGPFRVQVLGTQFRIRWDPRTEGFLLVLRRGRVKLNGPVVGSRVIQAGETIQINLARRQMSLSQEGTDPANPDPATPRKRPAATDSTKETRAKSQPAPEPAPGTAPGTDPEPDPEPKTGATGSDPKPEPKTGATGSFPDRRARFSESKVMKLVRTGRYEAALRAAQRHGWPAVLDRAPASTLLALGDASRLAGQQRRAWTIYVALRRRFPGSHHAAIAAFSLGRMAFDGQRDPAGSARWFDLYLNERPKGPLAREALGRLLETHLLGGDRPRARETARVYLTRYPDGPHAKLARSLVRGAP